MTPFVAFGYQKVKADKHKLEIDPVAGSVVQDIFKMKLQGMSQDAIANRLNELGVLLFGTLDEPSIFTLNDTVFA